MAFFLKTYRPDPFKFRPAHIRQWLYGFFRQQNLFLLRTQFQCPRITLSSQSLQHLKQIRPGQRTLLVLNHICFVDPHILFELSFRAGFCPKWLAGIEPFDSMNGIMGWHMQSTGCFSIDRGVLDRLALQTAQSVLDEGPHPLVIYPEGEAAYTNKVLQPFFPGVALFALNTAEKYQNHPQPVQIVPVAVVYRFQTNPERPLRQAIQTLNQKMHQAAVTAQWAWRPMPIDDTAPFWAQLKALTQTATDYLANHYQCDPFPAHAPLTQRLIRLRDDLLQRIHMEHLGESPPAELSDEALMMLKNKLRSLIARKCYAPPMAELMAAIGQVDTWQAKHDQGTKPSLKQLQQLETQWIGQAFLQEGITHRLKRLRKHLSQQKPYAQALQAATPADRDRWKSQINQTRQIKLLTLLVHDLARQDATWEGIDETLVKLEILLFSQFKYRGPKEALVAVGAPMDVKQFIADHPDQPIKALQAPLTETLRQTIQGLLHSLWEQDTSSPDGKHKQTDTEPSKAALSCR